MKNQNKEHLANNHLLDGNDEKAIEIYESLGRECDDPMILLNHPCAITTNNFVQDLMNLLSNFNKDYNRINGEDAKLYPEKLIEQFKNYYLD